MRCKLPRHGETSLFSAAILSYHSTTPPGGTLAPAFYWSIALHGSRGATATAHRSGLYERLTSQDCTSGTSGNEVAAYSTVTPRGNQKKKLTGAQATAMHGALAGGAQPLNVLYDAP